MPFKAEVVVQEVDVENEIEAMQLSVEILHAVLKHIRAIKNDQTEDHPSWGRGITPASEGVFKLRELSRKLGWRRESDSKFELTVHDKLDIALNIARGNSATGQEGQNPETAYSKGVCTKFAIEDNQLLLDLPPPERTLSSEGDEKRSTWYLLYNEDDGKIHSELSLPVGMSVERHVSLWAKRIILPSITLDGIGASTIGIEPVKADIKIKRKRKV